MKERMTIKEFFKNEDYMGVLNIGPFQCIRTPLLKNPSFQTKFKYLFDFIQESIDETNPPTQYTTTTGAYQYYDNLYFIHNGRKEVTSFVLEVREYLDTFQPSLNRLTALVNSIGYPLVMKYADKWNKLLKTIQLEYNPIHNYDMEENEKVNTYLETTDNTDTSTYGFNSSSESPTGKSENSVTVDGDWDNNKRNLTRKGNIGVTTSQQMIEAEIKLRQYNVLEQMFEDINSMLVLSVY